MPPVETLWFPLRGWIRLNPQLRRYAGMRRTDGEAVDCDGRSANCDLVTTNQVEPVYLVTSMAVTPSGSRRVGQYEVSAFNMSPPPQVCHWMGRLLTSVRPIQQRKHQRTDQSGTPPAVPNGCSTNFGNQPAIGTDNAADAASVLHKPRGLPTSPGQPRNYRTRASFNQLEYTSRAKCHSIGDVRRS